MATDTDMIKYFKQQCITKKKVEFQKLTLNKMPVLSKIKKQIL